MIGLIIALLLQFTCSTAAAHSHTQITDAVIQVSTWNGCQLTGTINGKQVQLWADSTSCPLQGRVPVVLNVRYDAACGQVLELTDGLLPPYCPPTPTPTPLPTPTPITALDLAPNSTTLAMGDCKQFTLVDQAGRPVIGASWVSNQPVRLTVQNGRACYVAGGVTKTTTVYAVLGALQSDRAKITFKQTARMAVAGPPCNSSWWRPWTWGRKC